MKNLSSKTLKELKDYAKENNIDIQEAKTKAKILSILLDSENLNKVVKAEEAFRENPQSSSDSNDGGTVISRPAEPSEKKVIKIGQSEKEKVAIYSKKNMRWQGVGQISKGYNIVTKEESEKWETLGGVRKATPEEVATYYGKS